MVTIELRRPPLGSKSVIQGKSWEVVQVWPYRITYDDPSMDSNLIGHEGEAAFRVKYVRLDSK